MPSNGHARLRQTTNQGTWIDRVSRAFGFTMSASAHARLFACQVFERWALPLSDDVLLVVAELASNALRHARSGFTVEIRRSPETVRIAVSDASPAFPQLVDVAPSAAHGKGLLIVDAVAEDWGWAEGPSGGKTVWVDLPAARTRP